LTNYNDQQLMQRAIELARQGLYTTTPNPRVGCVIVRDGEIIAEGYHQRAGEGHAEVNALARIGGDATGATCYVTLEPCSHTGRTGPCAEALVKANPMKVVIGMVDPNPQVAGRGIKMLQDAGIEVVTGVLEHECKQLNLGFLKRMQKGLPYVRLKLAMSLDGRTAMASGESQWITGAEARKDVQCWRGQSCAVVTGMGTWKHDNPQLTVRDLSAETNFIATIKRQPTRVLLDSSGKADLSSQFFNSTSNGVVAPVWWCTAVSVEQELPADITHYQIASESNGIDLATLLHKLADTGHNEVLFECGANLAASLIEQALVDELIVYIAPKLMGQSARPLAALNIEKMADSINLKLLSVKQVGEDIRLVYRLNNQQNN